MKVTDQKVFNELCMRLTANPGTFTVGLSVPEMITIICQLQLAQHHPANKGNSANLARSLIEQFLCTLESFQPAIGEFFRRGSKENRTVTIYEPFQGGMILPPDK